MPKNITQLRRVCKLIQTLEAEMASLGKGGHLELKSIVKRARDEAYDKFQRLLRARP